MIKYYIEPACGTPRKYLAVYDDKEAAILTLTRRKTLSEEDITALQTLGFECEQVIKP